jgi:hypothetical protein
MDGFKGFIAILTLVIGFAGTGMTVGPSPADAAGRKAQRTFIVPGTGYELRFGSARLSSDPSSTQALLAALMSWIAENSDLPKSDEVPKIAFVPASQLAELRSRNLPTTQAATRSASDVSDPRTNLALYEFATKTVYLHESWRGDSPADYSILVHELAHHLQNVGNVKYECPAQREKPAYRVQNRWLALFGSDLQQEFEIDPFTLLVTTSCGY